MSGGLVEVSCSSCRERFGLTGETYSVLCRSGAAFYCPHGHSLHFPRGESELEAANRATAAQRQRADRAEQELEATRLEVTAERHRANGYKGQATRLARRARAGVCPCCNRVFAELARHMTTEHPEFTPLEIAAGAPPLEPGRAALAAPGQP